jgi:hypothetical protein
MDKLPPSLHHPIAVLMNKRLFAQVRARSAIAVAARHQTRRFRQPIVSVPLPLMSRRGLVKYWS